MTALSLAPYGSWTSPISADLFPSHDIEGLVRAHPDFSGWCGGKSVQKMIVVPGRIVNLILG